MNVFIWILQGFVAIIFFYSGVNKSFLCKHQLIAKGQTGVKGLSLPLIRFIGITEILGVTGIIFPCLLNISPGLTAIAAICLALIMIPAAIIHYKIGRIENKQKENKDVWFNIIVFLICLTIAFFRIK